MILTSVSLKDFRSHLNSSINFSNGLNYIIGGNGQGKTSILEAVYYLCTTKSNLSRSDSEAIRFNQDAFQITGRFNDMIKDEVKIIFSSTENKKFYYLNNKLLNRASDIIGRFPVVVLTPSDHAITQGPPAERRKLVDSIIAQASSNYLNNIIDYNKTLRQRSALLYKLRETRRTSDYTELESWTEKLISTGTEIIIYRKKFILEYSEYLIQSYSQIMNDLETPSIKYSFLEEYDGDDIKKKFESLITSRREEEIRRGVNLVGPHRDDFILEINGYNIKSFGSQGQNKTFQTAMRFAEFFYLKDVSDKTPIFLLDDVFGELDAFRAIKISEYLRKVGQAIITLTDFANFTFFSKEVNDSIIKLHDNKISYA